MYVCICNQVTESQVATAVSAGCDMRELQDELGVATCCGCCEPAVNECIAKHRPLAGGAEATAEACTA